MIRTSKLFLVFPLIAAFACGGTSLPDGCEIQHDGTCYEAQSEACEAAGCPLERCIVLETYPGQIECESRSSGGEDISVSDTMGDVSDAVQSDAECGATFDGDCFTSAEDACEAAGCGMDTCQQMESYPVQVACP